MAWTFSNLQYGTLAGNVSALAFDGRDIWASSGTQVKIFGYWDADSQYEYLSQNYAFDKTPMLLKEKQTITVAGAVDAMQYWNGVMYIKDNNTIRPYTKNATTQQWGAAATFATPVAMWDDFCVANNKIWFTTTGYSSSMQNQLYYYDIVNETWSSPIPLPGAHQLLTRPIVDGLDGYIYLTAHNEHSIIKVDTSTGNVISSTFFNRHPYKLGVDQDKNLYVVSDEQGSYLEGMVQKMTSAGTITEIAAAGGGMKSLCVDEYNDKLWYVGKAALLGRMDPATTDYRMLDGSILLPTEDFTATTTAITVTAAGYDKLTEAAPGGGKFMYVNYTYGPDSVEKERLIVPANLSAVTIPKSPATVTQVTSTEDGGELGAGPSIVYDAWPSYRPTADSIALITPQMYYEKWNGASLEGVTVKPYLVYATKTKVVALRLGAMLRVNILGLLGTGIIGDGPQNYMGD